MLLFPHCVACLYQCPHVQTSVQMGSCKGSLAKFIHLLLDVLHICNSEHAEFADELDIYLHHKQLVTSKS